MYLMLNAVSRLAPVHSHATRFADVARLGAGRHDDLVLADMELDEVDAVILRDQLGTGDRRAKVFHIDAHLRRAFFWG